MKKMKFLLAAVVAAGISVEGYSQTYNIPSASTTSTTYLGSATGDLNLKSTAGSLFLNTNGNTTTAPNLGINTEGNVGVGLLPALNPGSGFYFYQPTLTVKGVDANDNVPAWAPRSTFRINTGASNMDFGILSGRGFMRSGSLALYSSDVYIGSTNAGGGSVTAVFGQGGNEIQSGFSGVSKLQGYLVVGGGIGSLPGTPAGYGLYVGRGILTEKVKVAINGTGNWSDYVFDKDYKLLSLGEVESYVKKNKHLPGVPSAEEVVKEGIDMATMDAKLLEKIEELTLYMIAQQKQIEVLKQEIVDLKNQ